MYWPIQIECFQFASVARYPIESNLKALYTVKRIDFSGKHGENYHGYIRVPGAP